jgi:hypothetical protein
MRNCPNGVIRKAYGFRTFEAVEVALTIALARYRNPEWTDAFC